MTPRGLVLAALLLGPAAAQGPLGPPAGSVLPLPTLPTTALPAVTEPTPVVPNTAVLLDGQRLTISLSFRPGEGAEYPPAGPFSRDQPAYYPMREDAPLSLSVQSSLPGATLVLRAAPVSARGQPALPVDRIEYSVGGAPFQPCQGVQVIALLPATGSATYDIRLRLRLEGDEPAGLSQVMLSWSVEAR